MLTIGHASFEPTLARIRSRMLEDTTLTRSALSREVCHWLGWHTPTGRPKEVSCRIALQKLERRGLLTLPEARKTTFKKTTKTTADELEEHLWPEITANLADVERIFLIPVNSTQAAQSRLWWAMMRAHHPQGASPLCGAQLRYLIGCEIGGKTAYIGGLGFSAPAWRLNARDTWIGWNDNTRCAGLSKIVCNSRFLILPTVHIPNLASHVLSMSIKRLPADWQANYGITPALLETFVDRATYRGTCYRAANWTHIGQTQGRGRQDRQHAANVGIKDILIYRLHPQWRNKLCPDTGSVAEHLPAPASAPTATATPAVTPAATLAVAPRDWAEQEFGHCALSDARLKARLLTVARDFYARPTANIAQACSSRAKTKAAYRFFDHEETTMQTLLKPHYAATQARIGTEKIVLAVQDTTSANYTPHAATTGIGAIGTTLNGPQGLHLHSTLAFSTSGTPLGFIDVQCWARDPAQFGKKALRHKLPIEEKESFKWIKSYRAAAAVQACCPDTIIISVGDREADIYALFLETIVEPAGPKLLVRAMQNRVLRDEQQRLWETMQARAPDGMQALSVPRQGNRAARTANLAIRYAQVMLEAPKAKKGAKGKKGAKETKGITEEIQPNIVVWAVLAQEQNAPQGVVPLEWMLLTTMPVTSFAQAIETLAWYAQRWGIEVMHRILKSGCRIERRQLADASRIEACLAIDLVIAWRIQYLNKLGREVPDAPCTIYFEEDEWKALMVFTNKNPIPPKAPPTLREAIRLTATLGGFLGRKSDGEPGTQTLWIGLQRLDDITNMYRVFRDATQIPVSSGERYG